MLGQLHVFAISRKAQKGMIRAGNLEIRCSLGRSGTSFLKREGDGATPAGVFRLRRLFYRSDRLTRPISRLSAGAIGPQDGWCEAVGDRNYNRPVRMPYAGSRETMRRDDHLYDLVVTLSHNERPRIQGLGSAVFLHLRRVDRGPTAGCLAVSLNDMRKLLRIVTPATKLVIGNLSRPACS
jgi:L,D-peptidoglycan transpeptidase YkuD (ErfK/YbiS/YcfS/YnhG family)